MLTFDYLRSQYNILKTHSGLTETEIFFYIIYYISEKYKISTYYSTKIDDIFKSKNIYFSYPTQIINSIIPRQRSTPAIYSNELLDRALESKKRQAIEITHELYKDSKMPRNDYYSRMEYIRKILNIGNDNYVQLKYIDYDTIWAIVEKGLNFESEIKLIKYLLIHLGRNYYRYKFEKGMKRFYKVSIKLHYDNFIKDLNKHANLNKIFIHYSFKTQDLYFDINYTDENKHSNYYNL